MNSINSINGGLLPAIPQQAATANNQENIGAPNQFILPFSPTQKILRIAHELESALQSGKQSTTSPEKIDQMLLDLLNLLSINPVIAFNEKGLRELYAIHRLALLPPHIRICLTTSNPETERIAKTIPLGNQKQLFDALPTSMHQWNTLYASELKESWDMTYSFMQLPPHYQRQLGPVPLSIHRHLVALWQQKAFDQADWVVSFFARYPQNQPAASCLKQYSDRLLGDPVTALASAIQLIERHIKLFITTPLPNDVNWFAVDTIATTHDKLLYLIAGTQFSTSPTTNDNIKKYLVDVACIDAVYAETLKNIFDKEPELAPEFCTLFSPQESVILAPMSEWMNDLLKDSMIEWMDDLLSEGKDIKATLMPVAKFFKYNPMLAMQLARRLKKEGANLIARFSATRMDYKSDSISEFTAFVRAEGLGDPSAMHFQQPELPSKEEITALSESCGLQNWVSVLFSQHLYGDAYVHLTIRVFGLLKTIDQMPDNHKVALVHFANQCCTLSQVEKMTYILRTYPLEGCQLVGVAMNHPTWLPVIWSLCRTKGPLRFRGPLLFTQRGVPANFIDKLASIDHLSADQLLEAMHWHQLNPSIANKWAALATRGLIVPIHLVPENLLDQLIADEALHNSCQHIPFTTLADEIGLAAAADLQTLCRLLKACAFHSSVLTTLLPALYNKNKKTLPSLAPLHSLICQLNEGNSEDQSLASTLLFLIRKLSPPNKETISFFRKLSNLINGGDKQLSARLLDMAKASQLKYVLPFLDKPSDYSPLTRACLPLASSRHAKVISNLQAFGSDENRLVQHVLCCPNLEHAACTYLPYLSDNSLEKILFTKALDALESASPSALQQAIKIALLHGDCALAEALMKRNDLLPNIPLSCQEFFWDLKQEPKTTETYPYLEAMLQRGLPPEDASELAGLFLLLADHSKDQHGDLKTAYKTITQAPHPLQMARPFGESTIRKAVNDWHMNQTAQTEEAFEGSLADMLSTLIITSGGVFNRGILPLLQRLLPSLLPGFQSTMPENDFLLHITTVCRWLENDRRGIRHLLAALRNPPDPKTNRYRTASAFTSAPPTQASMKRSVLSALFIRLRQADAHLTCFATAIAIESLSTYAGSVRATKDYNNIIQHGVLKLEKTPSSQRRVSLPGEAALPVVSGSSGLMLARTRELLFTQLDFCTPLKLLDINRDCFSDPRKAAAAFSRLFLFSLQEKDQSGTWPNLQKHINEQLTLRATAIYDPKCAHAERTTIGSLRLLWKGQAIDSPQCYLNMLDDLLTQLERRYTDAADDRLRAAVNTCKMALQKSGQAALTEILMDPPSNCHIAEPLINHNALTVTPWRKSDGGWPPAVRRLYFKTEKSTDYNKLARTAPEHVLHRLLTYGKDWPLSVRDDCSENPTKLIYFSSADHACNLRAAPLLQLLENNSPSSAIARMKEEALQKRAQVLTIPMQICLSHTFSKALAPSDAFIFTHLLREGATEKTLGKWVDEAHTVCRRVLTKSALPIALISHWENSVRTLLGQVGISPPSAVLLIDLNSKINGHNNDYLGYGGSIITGEILEFRGSPHGEVVAQPYTMHEDMVPRLFDDNF